MSAFPVLLFQEVGFPGRETGIVPESFAPIEPVSIIRRATGFDLNMATNGRFRVSSKFESFASLKHPAALFVD